MNMAGIATDTMSFIGIDRQYGFHSQLLQGSEHGLCLVEIGAEIPGTMDEQGGSLAVLDVFDRRHIPGFLKIINGHEPAVALKPEGIGIISPIGEDIADAGHRNRSFVAVRVCDDPVR